MVFVKFHNMKQEKKNFQMSPLNSNKLTNLHFTTSQNNIMITVHKCSVFFSSFFNLCTVYFTKKMFIHFPILQSQFTNVQFPFPFFFSSFFFSMYVLSVLLTNVRSFFLFFYMLCSTMFKFLFFFFSVLFPLSCTFFCFCFPFFSLFFHNKLLIHCTFFHNKLLIHCPFFFNLISPSLYLYLTTITIGSLPSLFDFNLYLCKINQVL